MTDKTVAALWRLYFARRVKGKKSATELTRQYERYVHPQFSPRSVDNLTFEEIDSWHTAMRNTPYQANRVLSLLKTMLKFAQAIRWIPGDYNPASFVNGFPEKKRRRHMRPKEAPRVALEIRKREIHAPRACLYLWLLIFTGARSNEIKKAKWKNLHIDRIRLADHKTAESSGTDRDIILPPAAIDKLNELVPMEDRNPEGFIIDLAAPHYIWRTIRVDAKCKDLRIHDLRHTFGTYALEKGYSLDQIGEALHHSSVQTTKIYAELTDRSRRSMVVDSSVAILADMDVIDLDIIENDPLS